MRPVNFTLDSPFSTTLRKDGLAATRLFTTGMSSKNYLPAQLVGTLMSKKKLKAFTSPILSKLQHKRLKNKKPRLLSKTSTSITKVMRVKFRVGEEKEVGIGC